MKKIILIMCSLFLIVGCATDDNRSVENNDSPIQEPNNPNRGYNMYVSLKIKFINDVGFNILDPENQMINGNNLDVDIYGIDSYENEYPYNINYAYGKYIDFIEYEGIGYCMKLNNYEDKSQEIQQAFRDRGWLKYRITFPDNVTYEIKIEGALRTTVDYYPTKIFVNDELKWQQIDGEYTHWMDITIVK